MPTLAARLRSALDDRPAASQAELARQCGVSPASVADWLSGESKTMKALPLLKAAKYLNVDPMWLLTGSSSTSQPHTPAEPPHAAMPGDLRDAGRWPFRFITPDRWAPLPALDKARVETFADATLQAWEARHLEERS